MAESSDDQGSVVDAEPDTKSDDGDRNATEIYLVDWRDGKVPWGWGRLTFFAAFPLFGAVALVASPWAVSRIENKLLDDARADLAEAGIESPELFIDFDYRDGRITGVLPDGVLEADVEAAVADELLGDFEVAADRPNAGAAQASPTAALSFPVNRAALSVDERALFDAVEVMASFNGRELVVTGTVVDEGQLTAVADAVDQTTGRFVMSEDIQVVDAPASPAADAMVADLVMAIEALAGAKGWTAVVSDGMLEISATSPSPEQVAALRELRPDLISVPTQIEVNGLILTGDDVEEEIMLLQVALDELSELVDETVVFASGTADLSDDAATSLDQVAEVIEGYPQPLVEVTGHTDDRGDASANQLLSEQRAQAVVDFLIDQGITPGRLVAQGAGQSEPIDTNDTPAGRENNRRVEFTAVESFPEE